MLLILLLCLRYEVYFVRPGRLARSRWSLFTAWGYYLTAPVPRQVYLRDPNVQPARHIPGSKRFAISHVYAVLVLAGMMASRLVISLTAAWGPSILHMLDEQSTKSMAQCRYRMFTNSSCIPARIQLLLTLNSEQKFSVNSK